MMHIVPMHGKKTRKGGQRITNFLAVTMINVPVYEMASVIAYQEYKSYLMARIFLPMPGMMV